MSTLKEKRRKERQKRRRCRIIDGTVIFVLAGIAVSCCIYLVYHSWSMHKKEMEYEKMRQTENVQAETEIMEQPTETEQGIYCEQVYDFKQLKEQNEDIYAWITVPGTQVDYPVLQSETDNYYLDYNLDHTKGYPGCLYTNACNQKDFSDYHTIIYGHNMKNDTMFGSLHDFEEETFFEEHDTIYVYTEEKRLTYEIYETVKYSDAYIPSQYNVNSAEGRDRFLQETGEYLDDGVSHVRENAEIGGEDRLLTLSTCVGGESSRRFLVIGVLREEALYR